MSELKATRLIEQDVYILIGHKQIKGFINGNNTFS